MNVELLHPQCSLSSIMKNSTSDHDGSLSRCTSVVAMSTSLLECPVSSAGSISFCNNES